MGLTDIKKLRELTSLGINDCKKALSEAKGNFDRALNILREKGIQMVKDKAHRAVQQGLVESYVHFGGNLGALVEINCETDFVARTEVFKKFAKEIAMQVAATNPTYLRREDISKDILDKENDIEEYATNHCLMEQAFIKDNKMSISGYLKSIVSQTGENIIIKRFIRFALGEADEG